MNKPARTLAERLFRPISLARVCFVLLATALAPQVAWDMGFNWWIFTPITFVVSCLIVTVEFALDATSSRKMLVGGIGLVAGLIFAQLLYPTIQYILERTSAEGRIAPKTARLISDIMLGYIGIVVALRNADWLRLGNLKLLLVNPTNRPKILDSSVIIDGRIVELIRLELVCGQILVPTFVLQEIQGIADSSDPYRRARGRRGLDVLDQLRTTCKTLDTIDTDYPDQPVVDQKLIRLSRDMGADLVTNDHNLHKIAQVHQIQVLNINELADALRPTVYVGETLELMIVKQGREAGQGVAYLKDGTMVVIEGGESQVGREKYVVVSNILQNPSGRLIFARLLVEEHERITV